MNITKSFLDILEEAFIGLAVDIEAAQMEIGSLQAREAESNSSLVGPAIRYLDQFLVAEAESESDSLVDAYCVLEMLVTKTQISLGITEPAERFLAVSEFYAEWAEAQSNEVPAYRKWKAALSRLEEKERRLGLIVSEDREFSSWGYAGDPELSLSIAKQYRDRAIEVRTLLINDETGRAERSK